MALAAFVALSMALQGAGPAGSPGAGHAEPAPCASPYGRGDSLGALNRLTADSALAATRLVRTGRTYSLAVATGPTTPAPAGRGYRVVVAEGGDPIAGGVGDNLLTGFEELIIASPGVGTKLAGLAHAGTGHLYYDCARGADIFDPQGLKRFQTSDLPPVVSRGVLLDIAALKGVPRLAPSTPITPDDLVAAERRQGVSVRTGDVVLVHTGWQSLMGPDPAAYLRNAPGLSLAAERALVRRGVVILGADTTAVEVLPAETPGQRAPGHQELLARSGVYMLQNVRTEELARDRVYEFLFVLGVPRFTGTAQMVVHPVAIR